MDALHLHPLPRKVSLYVITLEVSFLAGLSLQPSPLAHHFVAECCALPTPSKHTYAHALRGEGSRSNSPWQDFDIWDAQDIVIRPMLAGRETAIGR